MIYDVYTIIQCLLSGIWKKDDHSNEVIFQYEITINIKEVSSERKFSSGKKFKHSSYCSLIAQQ